jgi:hypothetical protein
VRRCPVQEPKTGRMKSSPPLRGASRGLSHDEEKDVQEFLKNFLPLPVPRYWISSVVVMIIVTIILAIGLAAFLLSR